MVVLDTSALTAAIDLDEFDRNRVASFLAGATGLSIVPVGILSEATFILDKRFGRMTTDTFLKSLESGSMVFDCGEDDLPRIRALMGRYRDLPLGYADTAVVVCADRNGGTVATLDLRHFAAVAREGTIQIVPEFASARERVAASVRSPIPRRCRCEEKSSRWVNRQSSFQTTS